MPIFVMWACIFLAMLAMWFSALRWWGAGLLVAGYGIALATGQLGWVALVLIAFLLLLAYCTFFARPSYLRVIGHAVFILMAVALTLHRLPSFHNLLAIGPQRFTAGAVPFKMYLNLDKPLIAVWLLLFCPWIRVPPFTWRTSFIAGGSSLVLTVAVCLTIALILGAVKWEPKWPSVSGLWLLNNLLLDVTTEETFFRGYLQGGISRLLKQSSHAHLLAIVIAAVLFGLVHLPGGWQWAALATVAGIGYGLAYRFGGLPAAILTHFGLNAVHFFLFTYPMLQAVK